MTNTGNIPPPPQQGNATSQTNQTQNNASSSQNTSNQPPYIPAKIDKLPNGFLNLPRSVQIGGQVINTDPKTNSVQVRTAQGDIVLRLTPQDGETAPRLPNTQTVSLQINAGSPPETLQLQIVDKPVNIQAPQTPEVPAPTQTTLPAPIETGQVITAIITDAPAESAEQAAIIASKNIEAVLAETLVKLNLPISSDLNLPDTSPAASLAASGPDISAIVASIATAQTASNTATEQPRAETQSATPHSPLAAILSVIEDNLLPNTAQPQNNQHNLQHLNGQIFQFTVLSTSQSNETVPAPPPQTGSQTPTVTAQVVEQSPIGLTIVNIQTSNVPQLAPDTQLILQTPVSTPNGTLIEFAVQPLSPEQFVQQLQTPASTTSTAGTQAPAQVGGFQPLFSLAWPALQEVIQLSNTALIPEIATALRNTIPSPASPARLIPTALFFLAALRLGSVDQWLGEKNLDALRQSGRRDLLTRLTGDFSNISRQSQETLSGDWRGVSIPLLNQDEIEMMQLYSRQQDDDAGQGDGEQQDGKTTRFLLNLRLSNLGDLQLDGFLRHQKTLDVFLRTETPFPADIRQQLLKAFHDGLESAELEGGQLVFQSETKHWVDVPKPSNGSDTQVSI